MKLNRLSRNFGPSNGRDPPVSWIPADIDQDGDIDILVPGEAGQTTTGITALNILVKDDSGGWMQSAIPIPTATRDAGAVPGLRGTAFGIDKDGMGYVLTAGYDRLSLVKIPFGLGRE